MQEHAASQATAKLIEDALAERFGEACPVDADLRGLDELARIAGHRVHRRFLPRAVEPKLMRLLCACALSARALDLGSQSTPHETLKYY